MGTYWEEKGRHQKLCQQLMSELVPAQGRADSTRGELLRAVGHLYYDLYNNGCCNYDLPHFRYYVAVVENWDDELVGAGLPRDVLRRTVRRMRANNVMRWSKDEQHRADMELLVDAAILAVGKVRL